MAIVHQDFGFHASTFTTNAVTVGTSWAAGETCLALIVWYGTQTLSSVAMDGESNLTLIGSPQTGGPDNARSQWAVLDNVTGTGSKAVTATLSAAPTAQNIAVWRLSGCNTSGAVDVNGGASGNSTTPSVSLTTTVANAAVFAHYAGNGGFTSPGTGYTAEGLTGAYWYERAEYNIDVGAAGAKTVDMTISSAQWVFNAIAIKPAAGGATDTPVNPGAGTLTITGYAPTVAQTANQSVNPGAGTLTFTGYAPTITQPQTAAPGVGLVTITGHAPTVTQQADTPVNPGAGALTITGYAPAIAQTANQAADPGTGSLAIQGYAPTIAQTVDAGGVADAAKQPPRKRRKPRYYAEDDDTPIVAAPAPTPPAAAAPPLPPSPSTAPAAVLPPAPQDTYEPASPIFAEPPTPPQTNAQALAWAEALLAEAIAQDERDEEEAAMRAAELLLLG